MVIKKIYYTIGGLQRPNNFLVVTFFQFELENEFLVLAQVPYDREKNL